MTPAASRVSFFLSWGLLLLHRVTGKDCDTDEIGVAMLSCQEERETLSDASRSNDTSQLCQALQQYSECIGPKIVGCKGEALMAFNVIKQQYAGAPYNCDITDAWSDDNHFQNDVNSQLMGVGGEEGGGGGGGDNHIVTNPPPPSPTPDVGRVTVAALPVKTEGVVREEEPPAEVSTTPASTRPPSSADLDPTSTATTPHTHHLLSLLVSAVVAVACLAVPLTL